jgi:hypothetical protein
MEDEELDDLLVPDISDHKEKYPDKYIDHYVEQYRIYLHVFNSTIERRTKANEFFLGINTAIMAFLGYIEAKDGISAPSAPIIFTLVPVIGVALCYSWYLIINSYTQLNRAKFKVIHRLETKLPARLFKTEWRILGMGKDVKKYKPMSHIEKMVPQIFIVLYFIIFFANLPYGAFERFIH